MDIRYEWRGPVTNAELNPLHAEGFGTPVRDDDWVRQLEGHSLGWVCARRDLDACGFASTEAGLIAL